MKKQAVECDNILGSSKTTAGRLGTAGEFISELFRNCPPSESLLNGSDLKKKIKIKEEEKKKEEKNKLLNNWLVLLIYFFL